MMAEHRGLLDHGVAGIDPRPDSYERVLRRVRRRRLRRRAGVGLLAGAVFAGRPWGCGWGSCPPRPAPPTAVPSGPR